MTDKLTPKQERFWIEYLATGNASEAYRSGPSRSGPSSSASSAMACAP
jgi:phage terminase small subunit